VNPPSDSPVGQDSGASSGLPIAAIAAAAVLVIVLGAVLFARRNRRQAVGVPPALQSEWQDPFATYQAPPPTDAPALPPSAAEGPWTAPSPLAPHDPDPDPAPAESPEPRPPADPGP
jgi:hypothetical protein